MRIELSAIARGVRPEAAVAWWADLRDGTHDHAFMPGESRAVVGRLGSSFTLRDEVRVLRLRVFHSETIATAEPLRVRFEGTNTFSRFVGAYSFHNATGGTKVSLVVDVDLAQPWRIARGVAFPLARALLRADLRQHVRGMERDFRR